MTEVADPPAGAAFASLMAGAANLEKPEAPFGYTRDRETGEMRPKKTPGRGGARVATPPVEALKAPQGSPSPGDGGDGGGSAPPVAPSPPADRPPEALKRGGRAARPADPLPAFKQGVIAAGVNKLYRKMGKVIRAADHDIGEAFIQAARNTGEDGEDDSVGAAWEALAKSNPRIRRFIMRALAGGAVSDLLMAHAPIAMAIMLKPAVMRIMPFSTLIASVGEPDEDTPAGEGGLPGGMTPADVTAMADLARKQAESLGIEIPPHVQEAMAGMAAAAANGNGPPLTVRNQPRRAGPRSGR